MPKKRFTATKPNERWAMDFVFDRFANGHRFRVLTTAGPRKINRRSHLRPKILTLALVLIPVAAHLLEALTQLDRTANEHVGDLGTVRMT